MAGPALFRPSDIPTGLKAYWKLDEASGSRADSSGNGNTLSDNNTVGSVAYDYWNSSGTNSADFERGNSEWLSITDGAQTGLDLNASDITFAVWFKSETAGAINPFISKGGSGYDLRVTAGNIVQFTKNTTSSNFTNAGVYAQRWYHLAVTHRNSDGQVCCYLDGKLTDVLTNADTISNNAFSVLVGDGQGTGNYWDGLMKDFGVWNVVLTPLQIKSLALGVDLSSKAFRPNRLTNLVSYWKLNEIGISAARGDSKGGNTLSTAVNLTNPAGAGFLEAVGVDLEASNTEALRISDGAQAGLDITGNISMGCWVKFESDTTDQMIMTKAYPGGNQRSWSLYFRGSDTKVLRFLTSANGVTYDGDAFSSVTLKAGRWYHVGARVNGTAMAVFVDGQNIGSGTSNGSIFNSSAYFMLGAYDLDGSGTPTSPMDGLISDAFICNGAISDNDFKKLASAYPVQQSNLVSYWKLNESGTPASYADSIGPNTLTTTNSPVATTGKVDNGADFEDGSSQYASIADGSQTGLDLDPQYVGSWLAWVKFETATLGARILDKQQASATGWSIAIGDASAVFRVSTGPGTLDATTSLSTGIWYQAIGEHEGANRGVGTNGAIENISGGNQSSGNAIDFNIARNPSGANYLDGVLDEIMVWRRKLMDEEYKVVYAKVLNGYQSDSDPLGTGTGNLFLVM